MGSAELEEALRREGAERAIQMVETARRESERLRLEDEGSWTRARREALAEAEAEVRARTEAGLMRARRSARRRVLEARHRAIELVLAAARTRLARVCAEGAHRSGQELLELLEYLPGSDAVVRGPSALAGSVQKIDDALDGFVITSADGAVTIDATLARRLDRLRPLLAIQILQMLEAAP
jgi:vacuolar-type H+-ATPase subunit E/Vma4